MGAQRPRSFLQQVMLFAHVRTACCICTCTYASICSLHEDLIRTMSLVLLSLRCTEEHRVTYVVEEHTANYCCNKRYIYTGVIVNFQSYCTFGYLGWPRRYVPGNFPGDAPPSNSGTLLPNEGIYITIKRRYLIFWYAWHTKNAIRECGSTV